MVATRKELIEYLRNQIREYPTIFVSPKVDARPGIFCSLYTWRSGMLHSMTSICAKLLDLQTYVATNIRVRGPKNPAIIEVPKQMHVIEFVRFIVREIIFDGEPPAGLKIQVL